MVSVLIKWVEYVAIILVSSNPFFWGGWGGGGGGALRVQRKSKHTHLVSIQQQRHLQTSCFGEGKSLVKISRPGTIPFVLWVIKKRLLNIEPLSNAPVLRRIYDIRHLKGNVYPTITARVRDFGCVYMTVKKLRAKCLTFFKIVFPFSKFHKFTHFLRQITDS